MGKRVFTNAYLLLNAVNLSDHIEQVTLTWGKQDVPVTAMGDGGIVHLAGLEDNKLAITFWQDHAAASVGPTLDAIFQAGTAVAFKLADAGTAISATNPSYAGSVVALEQQPVAGKVGDGQQNPVTFVVSGTITQGTT